MLRCILPFSNLKTSSLHLWNTRTQWQRRDISDAMRWRCADCCWRVDVEWTGLCVFLLFGLPRLSDTFWCRLCGATAMVAHHGSNNPSLLPRDKHHHRIPTLSFELRSRIWGISSSVAMFAFRWAFAAAGQPYPLIWFLIICQKSYLRLYILMFDLGFRHWHEAQRSLR